MLDNREISNLLRFNIFSIDGSFKSNSTEEFFEKKYFVITSINPLIKDLWMIFKIIQQYCKYPSIFLCCTSSNFNLVRKFIKKYNDLNQAVNIVILSEEILEESLLNKSINPINRFIDQFFNDSSCIEEIKNIFNKFFKDKLYVLTNLINYKITKTNIVNQQTINVGLIVHARMSSTRLPGKAMYDINGEPVIFRILSRLSQKFGNEKVFLSTSTKKNDDILQNYVESKGFKVYRGEEDNLVKRFLDIALDQKLTHVIRITGDDLFRNLNSLDLMIEQMIKNDSDYIFSNDLILGCNSEIMNLETLLFINDYANDLNQTHALTWFLDRKEIFNITEYKHNYKERNLISLMLDEANDYESIKNIWKNNDKFFSSNWSYDVLLDKINDNLDLFEYYPSDIGLLKRENKGKHSFIFDH